MLHEPKQLALMDASHMTHYLLTMLPARLTIMHFPDIAVYATAVTEIKLMNAVLAAIFLGVPKALNRL